MTRRFAIQTGLLAAVATLVATLTSAQTGPAPSFEALASVLPVGTTVLVKDAQGKTVKGVLVDLAPTSLTVRTSQIKSYDLSFDAAHIDTVRKVDSTRNGFWIGFTAGAIPGLLLGAGFNKYCYNESPSHCPSAFVILGGATALTGGFIGKGIDAAITGGPVLFSRPSSSDARVRLEPFASRDGHEGGVMVRWSF